MSNTSPIAVIGAGSWGTTLAGLFGNTERVILWSYDKDVVTEINEQHTNTSYTDEWSLPSSVTATADLQEALSGASLCVIAVPSAHFCSVIDQFPEDIAIPLVSVTKGFVDGSSTPSQVLSERFPELDIAVLAGPNIAKEFHQEMPSITMVSSTQPLLAHRVADLLTSDTFAVSVGTDPIGAEIAGALKNPLAILSGIAFGLGYGVNTRSAIIAKGLTEMEAFGRLLQADSETFHSPAAVGDLFCTCSSENSRNFRCGRALASGKSLDEAIASMNGMVVEGVEATATTIALASAEGLSLPLFEALHAILFDNAPAKETLKTLWSTGGIVSTPAHSSS